jgi:integrase
MTMPTRSLTVTSVLRIKPPKEGQADYFDSGFPGLALRVSYGGAKTFIFFYRLHGKLRRLSLGRYPAMSLAEARDAWRTARLAVSKGESPAHIRPTTADSFTAVAEEWLQRDQAQNRSAAEVRRVIERDVLPAWGDRPITTLTRRDVLELVDGVADRGALTMARRLHAHLHRLFRWAVGRGIVETNPMADLPKPGEAVARDRVLTDAELSLVWKAAEKIGWPFGPAVRLLILTASRREEIGSLAWAEIQGNGIRLPAERNKSGEPRIIPLSPAATKLIEGLPRRGDRVFTTNGTTAISGWGKAKRMLDAAAGELNGKPLAPWRLHDIRRTAATGLQRLGAGLQVIESVLGHVGGSRAGIVGIYQRHRFEAEKRAALEAWALEIERIVRGDAEGGDHVISPAAARLGVFEAVNAEWLRAIQQADSTGNPEALVAYLYQLKTRRLGTIETFLLRLLLERVTFKRKRPGNRVPLGQKSRSDVYRIGAAYVRELQRTEGLPQDKAIDVVVGIYPQWFEDDAGASLANFMKRGEK